MEHGGVDLTGTFVNKKTTYERFSTGSARGLCSMTEQQSMLRSNVQVRSCPATERVLVLNPHQKRSGGAKRSRSPCRHRCKRCVLEKGDSESDQALTPS